MIHPLLPSLPSFNSRSMALVTSQTAGLIEFDNALLSSFVPAKRQAEVSLERPLRKSSRLTVPKVDGYLLLCAYKFLKDILHMNIEFAIKHELTEGLPLHDEMFGKNWNRAPDVDTIWEYSFLELAEIRDEEMSTKTSSKILVSWFGDTPEEREINMRVLELMAYTKPTHLKPYPSIVRICAAPRSETVAELFTLKHAKELCEYWGSLTPEMTPCKGGLDELSRRAKVLVLKYQSCISKGGKNGPGYRKDSFLRFWAR